MTNDELKQEADSLIRRCSLSELLAGYPDWYIGGSYSYDLMCWGDLDVYALDPELDLRRCFRVGYELTARLKAVKSRFTNNINGKPNGLYWGIKLGDVRRDAWKLDVWFLDQPDYQWHRNYCAEMRRRLTDERSALILAIKSVYWQRPEYRDSVTSDLVYRAVLDNYVKNVAEFEQFVKENVLSTD